MTTLWSGRFAESPNERMAAFHRSCDFDNVLIREDIAGSKAWASALHQCGILTKHENDALQNGLDSIGNDYDSGLIALLPTDEDIHMAVERLLTERIGKAGEKLHTGRSRNDQVATDLRLYTMKQCDSLTMLVTTLQQALLDRAEADRTVIIPGYTHLQPAQPLLFAHYLLSLFFMLERDYRRFADCRKRFDACPQGAGALVGSGVALDRGRLARELGFSRQALLYHLRKLGLSTTSKR